MSNEPSGKTIFVVEDDDDIRELTLYALESAGFTCRGFTDTAPFFAALDDERPDCVLLDVMLPGEDGLTALKRIRAGRYSDLPVILTTARGSEYDKVVGLNVGADDYVTKPFGILELIARVHAVLRRKHTINTPKGGECLTIGGVTVNVAKRTVSVVGEAVTLTFTEFELLRYLMINPGVALSRDKIMDAVWGVGYVGESRTVDMHVKSLRRKLGSAGDIIKTIRHIGYKIGE